jgi:hypothetical protein
MQGCKVKAQILQEVMNIVVIRLQKGMEEMVILHLLVLGLIHKCGHKPISLYPPGSRTKQDRIILFP